MRRNQKRSNPKVFFNASVVLAGLYTPSGGSGTLLARIKQKKMHGMISEIVLDEILRHADKIGYTKITAEKRILLLFSRVYPAPHQRVVQEFSRVVSDQCNAHILASTRETHADFLVTLDKKHLLVLQNKIKWVNIVSPKELLEYLAKS